MKLGFQKIFNIISITFISLLIIVYSVRFFYFKFIMDKKNNEIKDLSMRIIEKSILYKESNIYYFKGKSDNNYVMYSNQLWQIVSLTKDDLLLISVKPITNMYFDNSYELSNINHYLNNDFYNILDKSLIKETTTCITDAKKSHDKCNNKYTANVVLPNFYIYDKVGGKDSYINNGYCSYLSDSNDSHYYIDSKGDIGVSLNKFIGIKPMITIKSSNIIEGSGNLNDPYLLDTPKKKLSSANVGSYISFSNRTWRILSNDDYSRLVLNDALEKKEYQNKEFNIYNNIYKYLNEDFYSTLVKEYMVEFNTYNGSFDGNEKAIYSEITSFVGIPYLYDLYLNDVDNYALSTFVNYDNLIYSISNDGMTSQNSLGEYGIRPVIAIKNNLSISGRGTLYDPYIIEGVLNEED